MILQRITITVEDVGTAASAVAWYQLASTSPINHHILNKKMYFFSAASDLGKLVSPYPGVRWQPRSGVTSG